MMFMWSHSAFGLIWLDVWVFFARTVLSCGLEILFHWLRAIFKLRADGSGSDGAVGEDAV